MNEEEQRQRIATLFDLNTMSNKLSVCVAHLNELQNGDGAWSWYKGMPGNRYMTTQITEMLTRLQVMTGGKLNQALSAMYQKALNYLTVQAGKEYKAMKEAEKKGVTKGQSFRTDAPVSVYMCFEWQSRSKCRYEPLFYQ